MKLKLTADRETDKIHFCPSITDRLQYLRCIAIVSMLLFYLARKITAQIPLFFYLSSTKAAQKVSNFSFFILEQKQPHLRMSQDMLDCVVNDSSPFRMLNSFFLTTRLSSEHYTTVSDWQQICVCDFSTISSIIRKANPSLHAKQYGSNANDELVIYLLDRNPTIFSDYSPDSIDQRLISICCISECQSVSHSLLVIFEMIVPLFDWYRTHCVFWMVSTWKSSSFWENLVHHSYSFLSFSAVKSKMWRMQKS